MISASPWIRGLLWLCSLVAVEGAGVCMECAWLLTLTLTLTLL